MPSSAPVWDDVCAAIEALQKLIARTKSKTVNAAPLREEIGQVARRYLREAKGELERAGVPDLQPLDNAFLALLKLSSGRANAVSSYKRWLKLIRLQQPRVIASIESHAAHLPSGPRTISGADGLIAETLNAIVPSASLSYQQAIVDLSDADRVSFRGPALELREALRELLDSLAPDEDVTRGENFKLEPNQSKPTMRQKVQFVLRARGRSKTEIATPKDAADAVDGLLGTVVRSVYNQGSLATHVTGSRSQVLRLKRYVDVILFDLLEL